MTAAWLRSLTWKQVAGSILSAAAIGLTLWIGLSRTKDPTVLSILAVIAQVGSTGLFAQHRKADPGHARTIVRQLIGIRDQLLNLVTYIETVQEKRTPKATPAELREALGRANVETTILAEHSAQVVAAWGDFDPDTLRHLAPDPSDSQNSSNTGPGAQP